MGKIDQQIKKIEATLETIDIENENDKLADLISEKIALDNVKIVFSEKLGRIIG